MTELDLRTQDEISVAPRRSPVPYRACLLIGLGGLFAGVTGPLLSTFIPPLVRDAIGDHRTTIGVIMAIDNVLLLLLVPWTGPASDRAAARGRGRLPIVLVGFVLSAIGMALLPFSPAFGLPLLIGAIIVFVTAFILSTRGGPTTNAPEKRWRGQPLDLTEPSWPNRLKAWWKGRNRT